MGQQRSLYFVRLAMLGLAVLLPTLTLIPLGGLWLWDRGWVIYWALAVAIAVGIIYAAQWWMFGDDRVPLTHADAAGSPPDAMPAHWSPREEAAWLDVRRLADQAQPDKLVSRDAVLALGRETIEAVARRLHPEINDAFWHFTLPEAFALSEQVSRQMQKFVETSIPLGDRLTMRQILRIYRWRGALDVAEQAFDAWRVIRLVNPMTAATQEIRERLTKQLFLKGRDHIATRLTRTYVEEVGRAAIDLYGGRLKVTLGNTIPAETGASLPEELTVQQSSPHAPLNMLIVGTKTPGREVVVSATVVAARATLDSSSVAPLSSAAPHVLAIETIDCSTPFWRKSRHRKQIRVAAADADLVVCIGSATEIQSNLLQHCLLVISQYVAQHPRRRMPAVVAVVLRPSSQALAQAPALSANEIATLKMATGFREVQIVEWDTTAAAFSLSPPELAAEFGSVMPLALRAYRSRLAAMPVKRRPWLTLFGQVAGAGRAVIGAVRKK